MNQILDWLAEAGRHRETISKEQHITVDLIVWTNCIIVRGYLQDAQFYDKVTYDDFDQARSNLLIHSIDRVVDNLKKDVHG